MSEVYSTRQWNAERFVLSVIGLVVAPVAGGVLTGAAAAFVSLLYATVAPPSFTDIIPLFVFMGGALGASCGIPIALLVGWPVHALLLWGRFTHAAVYATVAGALSSLGFALVLPTGLLPLIWSWEGASFAALAGVIGGLIFWLIRRPDRDIRPDA